VFSKKASHNGVFRKPHRSEHCLETAPDALQERGDLGRAGNLVSRNAKLSESSGFACCAGETDPVVTRNFGRKSSSVGRSIRSRRGVAAPWALIRRFHHSSPDSLSLLGAGSGNSPLGRFRSPSLRRFLRRPRVANPPRLAISRRRSQLNLFARARPPISPAHAGQTNSASGCLSQCTGQF